jgi:hypothetical protein
MERFATAVRSSTLARLVNGDRAVTVCERSLGCMGILTWETGYALPAARAKSSLVEVHDCTAMRLSA